MTLLGKLRSKNQQTRLSAQYIDDLIVLSDTHVWTYVRLPLVPYEFLTDAARHGLLSNISLGLSGLLVNNEAVDCHLRITNVPVDPAGWKQAFLDRTSHPTPGFHGYLDRNAEQVRNGGFLTKEVYLGVCVGPRKGRGSAAAQGSLLSQFRRPAAKTEEVLGLEDYVLDPEELAFWQGRARDVRRNLAGSHLRAAPASAADVARLIRSPLHPALPVPTGSSDGKPWGRGEVHELAEGHIVNGYRTLAVEQPAGTGYTATFALSRFPDSLYFPAQEPWIHYLASLPFPVEFSSRFTLVPPQQVQKDIKKQLQIATDQANHQAEAGHGSSLQLQEQLETAVALEYTIGKDRQPFVYARHRIAVAASTPDDIDGHYLALRNHFRDLAIDVVWPSGDQLDLLCESQPGDRVRGKAYYQRHELALLSGGMPTASAEVGDRIDAQGRGWVGFYIGHTTSRVYTPVHYSTHVAAARNAPSGVAITGAPGGGKSFSAFLMAYQMTMEGVQTVLIDPKADAVPLGGLPGLGRAQVIDMSNGDAGILDPFVLGDDPTQCKLLAIETLRLLLGGKALDPEREQALFKAVEAVAASSNPSLGAVVDYLLADSASVHAQNLGTVLNMIRSLPYARLCFDSGARVQARAENDLTIITLLGLDLPPAELPVEDYGYDNRLSVSVMYLVTRHARRLMLNVADKNKPKAIFIDEAWAVVATPQGAKLIPEVARMGRSHNTSLVVISQNAKDIKDVQNSISTVFAFRSKNTEEISNVLALMGMEDDPDNHATIRDLQNGECLMKDVDGRIARVQFDAGDSALKAAFDTNPHSRGKAE